MPAFVLASLVSDDEDPDKFIWLEFWDLATPPTEEEGKESRSVRWIQELFIQLETRMVGDLSAFRTKQKNRAKKHLILNVFKDEKV